MELTDYSGYRENLNTGIKGNCKSYDIINNNY